MSDHVSDLSHDKITRFLASGVLDEKYFYEQVHLNKTLPPGGYLIFDDTVLDKSYSHKIQMVRRQYSGNAGGIIRGIGIVNMIYYVPEHDKFHLLGYRIFDSDLDNKSKIDHVSDMLKDAENYAVRYVGVLMDTWYAVAKLFQQINSLGKFFYCPIKANRLSKELNSVDYSPINQLKWDNNDLENGKFIKIKELNMDVKAYKVTVSTNRTDYVLTNDLRDLGVEQIQNKQKMRWNVECLHREAKQLTGIEQCQCRKAESQRTHIFCAMLVWNKIKETAYDTYISAYQVKFFPLRNYLINELSINHPIFA